MSDLKDKIDLIQNGEKLNAETLNKPVESLADEVDIKFSEYELVIQEGLTPAERAKLDGIAAGATKNRADSSNADKVHTHTWAQVTGQPATATRWPTYAEVTGKPTNYPTDWASVSSKPIVQITGTSTTSIMSQKATTDSMYNIPSVSKSTAYTPTALDKGKSIDTSAGVTLPASLFAVGDVIVVTNTSASNISITPAAGVTFRLAGSDSTGLRTLSGYGVATFRMVSNNVWFASGAGLS